LVVPTINIIINDISNIGVRNLPIKSTM